MAELGSRMKKIIFVSGIHGVGKSTFCAELRKHLPLKHYSCSTLIKENSDYIEHSKKVSGADKNQAVLLNALEKAEEPAFLLDGHFCLIGKDEQLIELEDEIFYQVKPAAIVNVTCPVEIVHQRLSSRDSKTFSIELLAELQTREAQKAEKISTYLDIPLFIHQSGGSLVSVSKKIDMLLGKQ